MSDATPEIDWNLTTWEGSRREQLRHWRRLSLRDRLRAVEEMADTTRRLQAMRGQARPRRTVAPEGVMPGQFEVREAGQAYTSEPPVHEITLHGCTPEPLMSYLKALGVLRLVSKQVDPTAQGFWRNGHFILRCRSSSRGLQEFFLNDYKPSPIVVPWSGNDFFDVLGKGKPQRLNATPTGSRILEAFLCCQSERLRAYREVISLALEALDELSIQKKVQLGNPSAKARYIAYLRSCAPDDLISWIDAASVLDADKATFNALLGSGGGSDGNTHFSDNFMQNLWDVLPDFTGHMDSDGLESKHWLVSALFGSLARGLVGKRTSSLFDAGAVGGPNATQGMERKAITNPWNFIFALEGSICFAGSLTKRLSSSTKSVSSFPFQVQLSTLTDSRTSKKETGGREIWLPLWTAHCRFREIEHLLMQGRMECNGKPARRTVDAALAVASLGVDQGIQFFQRYAIVKGRVGGENYNTACSLGQFDVKARRRVDLLRELEGWLFSFRRACGIGRKEEAPERFTGALGRIDSAIFNYCRYGGQPHFQRILVALGRAERELMRDGRWAIKNRVPPLHGLSADWIEASQDASPEYELALALANIRSSGDVGALRSNLEPVRFGFRKDNKSFAGWADQHRSVVWNQGDLSVNLLAVLARRVQDAARHSVPRLPLWSPYAASLESITAFLAGQTNDNRLEELLWGLLLIDPKKSGFQTRLAAASLCDSPPLSRLYALLKPLFLPAPIACRANHWRYIRGNEQGIAIRPEPRVLPLLRQGRIDAASRVASQRLRMSGLQPMIARNEGTWPQSQARRVAAALLFPIDSRSLNRLISLVVREESSAVQFQGEVA